MKRALLLFPALLLATRAQAHRPSDSYLLLAPATTHGALEGAWDIALRDLDQKTSPASRSSCRSTASRATAT